MLSFSQVLGTLVGALILVGSTLLLSKIITNKRSLLRFKRLSRGLPMASEPYLLGNHISSFALGEESCRKFLEEHERLGPNVGALLGDNFVMSTVDLDLIDRIIVDEAHLHLDRTTLNLPLKEFEESIMLLPGDRWQTVRRIVAPALKRKNFKAPNVIRELEDSISKLVAYIERKLDQRATTSTNDAAPELSLEVHDFVHKYTLDVVFSCFFKQYKLIDFDDPKEKWTNLADSIGHELQTSIWVKLSMIFPWFRHVIGWLMLYFHKQGFARRQILDFIEGQTKLRMDARQRIKEQAELGRAISDQSNFVLANGTKFSRNIIDNIADAYLDGKLTKSDYFNSTFLLFSASDKPVADSVEHTLYLLSIHQDVQERLRESIKSEGADAEYLSWVLLESLRLLPSVPVGCSRTVSRSIELENGHVVPKGTFVVTNAFAIHRLKQYWGEDAHEFRPARWRDTSQHHPMQFLAFGAGQRDCPGRELALFQMKMLFAALLTRYKFQGEPRKDAYKFNAPCMLFVIANSPFTVTITRFQDEP